MSRTRNRQRAFDLLQEAPVQDLDPESDADVLSGESVDGVDEDSSDDGAGRDHYIEVGKSGLRKAKDTGLGPRYQGTRVKRSAAFSDSEEVDPFENVGSAGSDSEEDVESDVDGEMSEEDEVAGDGADTADTEMSEDGEDDTMSAPIRAIDKSELRRAMAADRAAVTSSILAAAKSDAEKGRAIKRQRTAYDSLLNVRIKMQKSLIVSNSLVASSVAQAREDLAMDSIIEQAENAAFSLWSQLTAYREELLKSQNATASMPSAKASNEECWRHEQRQDEAAKSHRDAILQKWSMKSRGVAASSQRSKINTERSATIVDVLNEQLTNTDRLVERARTPRSCAPIQQQQRITGDVKIYDDGDFYGQLLKELLEAKSSSSSTAAVNIDIKSILSIRREAKTKKNVDTKASKGRKLKYTVHEKLQNFCAPDDQTTWSERQTDELFLSLFGQRTELREDDVTSEVSEDDVADAGLMLFRNGE